MMIESASTSPPTMTTALEHLHIRLDWDTVGNRELPVDIRDRVEKRIDDEDYDHQHINVDRATGEADQAIRARQRNRRQRTDHQRRRQV